MPSPIQRALLLACGLLFGLQVQAQSVALTGVLGTKALLVVDGAAPKALAAGESDQGVQLVSVSGDTAVVSIKGRQQTVRLGAAPVSVGGSGGPASGTRVVLTADNLGHFNGEEPGMKFIVGWLTDLFEGALPVSFVQSGDVFTFVTLPSE